MLLPGGLSGALQAGVDSQYVGVPAAVVHLGDGGLLEGIEGWPSRGCSLFTNLWWVSDCLESLCVTSF